MDLASGLLLRKTSSTPEVVPGAAPALAKAGVGGLVELPINQLRGIFYGSLHCGLPIGSSHEVPKTWHIFEPATTIVVKNPGTPVFFQIFGSWTMVDSMNLAACDGGSKQQKMP